MTETINHPISRRSTLSLCLLTAVCLAAALVGRLEYINRPFDPDGGMFVYMGKLTAEGGRFCHDLIDNKFPTVGLLTSICWQAFGARWWAYVVLQTALSLIAATMLARCAHRRLGAHAAWASALFALVYMNFPIAVFGGFQLETLQSFFSVLAACAAIESLSDESGGFGDAFLFGLAAACAAMVKPTALGLFPVFAVATLLRFHRRIAKVLKRLAASLIGFSLPAALVLGYLIMADILRDMPGLFRQISRYASETPWGRMDLIKPPIVLILIGFPFLVRGWIFRRPDRRIPLHVNPAVVCFVLLWFGMEFLSAVAQRRMYAYHFLGIAAPAALLFGFLPRRTTAGALFLSLMPTLFFSAMGAAYVLKHPFSPRLPASDYLLARTSPRDCIWQDSMPRLLLETNLRPGSRYPLTFLFLNYDTAPLEYTRDILADFRQRHPLYILLPADLDAWVKFRTDNFIPLVLCPVRRANYIEAWRQIRAYVQDHYVAEITLDEETIYRRR